MQCHGKASEGLCLWPPDNRSVAPKEARGPRLKNLGPVTAFAAGLFKLVPADKLLPPCRLFSRFTFAPRLLFHVARVTVYQAVRCTVEIKQTDDTTWQLRHKSRVSSSKSLGLIK